MTNVVADDDRPSAPLVIFIVGPSGIGKSAVLHKFMENADARFKPISLDDIAAEEGRASGLIEDMDAFALMMKVKTDGLFMIGITSLFRRLGAASDGEIYLVDVGAAFQNRIMLASLSFLYPVIGIVASEEVAFERFCKYRPSDELGVLQGATMSLERHKTIEYSEVRRKVYASATHTIDTTHLSLDETVTSFETIVRGIING
ncbi:ATP-binding protein [Mycobacterium paraterrae]|uniref:ATP-binding protein n=1 Tax=Mycobacterium paraterrae TaxID=577492 RepID=A0ABY3VLI1_9MYCO|nr:ATP-binding protein [Mycobacterium paraterrae]UMB69020.1 ATP-binding protein [Mycobacterium paraterrae]